MKAQAAVRELNRDLAQMKALRTNETKALAAIKVAEKKLIDGFVAAPTMADFLSTIGKVFALGVKDGVTKDKFDAARSQENLDDGKSKQTRTNILLGITGGLAVLTGVMAIALVDWKRTDTKLGVGPGTLLLEGKF